MCNLNKIITNKYTDFNKKKIDSICLYTLYDKYIGSSI